MATPKNLIKRGNVWWFRKRINGRRYQESLQTESITTAKDRRDQLLLTLREKGAATRWHEHRTRTFAEAVVAFKDDHYPTLKEKTRTRYTVSIENLTVIFKHALLSDITSGELHDFERSRRKHGVTNTTILHDLHVLSSIFTFADTLEWGVSNPVPSFINKRKRKGLRRGESSKRHFSHLEESEVLQHATLTARDFFVIAIDTGCRKEELYSLQWPHVDFSAEEIFIKGTPSGKDKGTKSGKDRYIPLWPRALEVLKRLHTERDPRCKYVFHTPAGDRYSTGSNTHYDALQTAIRRANAVRISNNLDPIPHANLHDLRRTCGCRLLQDRGFAIETVSTWLGHSDIGVTQRHYAFLGKADLHAAKRRALSISTPKATQAP